MILQQLGGNHSEVLFRSNDLKKITKISDFPDEFYETTKEDVLHVLKDLRQQQSVLSIVLSLNLIIFGFQ